jgi:hypothetical protein
VVAAANRVTMPEGATVQPCAVQELAPVADHSRRSRWLRSASRVSPAAAASDRGTGRVGCVLTSAGAGSSEDLPGQSTVVVGWGSSSSVYFINRRSRMGWECSLSTDAELVQVLVTDDLGRYLFAKSLLERDSIEYFVKGDMLRMGHGWAQTGFTETPLEPVEFWVRSEDAQRAQSLLRDLDAEIPGATDSSGDA